MATTRVFFEVEFWVAAHGPGFLDRYLRSTQEFFKLFKTHNANNPTLSLQESARDVLKARVDRVPERELKAFDFDDGNAQTLVELDLQNPPLILGIPEIGFNKQRPNSNANPTEQQMFPALEAWRSPIHRYWGTVFYDGDLGTLEAARATRCLLRAIFYPCQDLDDDAGRCGDFDEITAEEMTRLDPVTNTITYDGTFILGVFRWQAWRLKNTIGADGNPLGKLIGNGAGGGDHKFS
jgi:hypothetical protein